MRILLQHKGTGLYLRDVDAWSANSAEALDFVSSTAALDFCTANHVDQVQLVLRFEEEKYDIVLPVIAGMDYQTESPRPTV